MLLTPTEQAAPPAACVLCNSQGSSVPRKLVATGAFVGPLEQPAYLCANCVQTAAHTLGLLADGSGRLAEATELLEARESELATLGKRLERLLGDIGERDARIAQLSAQLEELKAHDRERRHLAAVAVASFRALETD